MKSSSVILALAAGSSAAIVARDTATILSDISSIDSQVKSLTGAIGGFTSLATAGPLITAEMNLETAIKKGTSDTQATAGPVSTADTNSILSAVASLIPDIVAALQAVVDKNGVFVSSGAITIVTTDVNNLQSETDAFANALIAIAPAAAGGSANAAKSCIDAAFASALATKSIDGSCASGITTIAGGAPSSSSSAPASSAPSSSAPASTTASSKSSAPTSTASGSSSVVPTSSVSTATSKPSSATGYPSGTGVGPTPSTTIPFTNGAGALKVGISGAVAMAVLALFM